MQTIGQVKKHPVASESIDTTTLTLIDGNFSHDEAKEILLKLFSDKINFHEMKNWSSQERFGEDDNVAQVRIPSLNKEVFKLQEILSEAKSEGMKLIISSEIKITLVND